jgi:hypothetical protein
MKLRKYLELSPEEAREHHLLRRRMEWLELKNSVGYRVSNSRRDDLTQTYSDICDGSAFCEQLCRAQTETGADSVN